MNLRLVTLYASAALVGGIQPGAAQVSGRVDALLGGVPTLERGGMASLWGIAPAVHYRSAMLSLDAEGEYRAGDREAAAASASLGVSHFSRLAGAFLGELAGTARARSGVTGMDGVVWELDGRLHLNGARRGAWLGLGAGQDLRGATSRWEAAAWQRFGRVSIQLAGSQTSAVDLVRLTTPGPDTLTPFDTTTARRVRVTTDLGAWLRWAPPRVDLALGLGRRYGVPEVAPSPYPLGDQTGGLPPGTARTTVSDWWLAEGTYWLTRQLGVNAAIGRSPPDRQFGTPGGRFLRLAVRATFGREGARPTVPTRGAAGLKLRRNADGLVFLELMIGTATTVRRVELMGDFTDWRPIELEPAGAGLWRLRLPLPRGMHYVNVRYDGGPWQPPPGTRVVADEFEHLTGVVVVE